MDFYALLFVIILSLGIVYLWWFRTVIKELIHDLEHMRYSFHVAIGAFPDWDIKKIAPEYLLMDNRIGNILEMARSYYAPGTYECVPDINLDIKSEDKQILVVLEKFKKAFEDRLDAFLYKNVLFRLFAKKETMSG